MTRGRAAGRCVIESLQTGFVKSSLAMDHRFLEHGPEIKHQNCQWMSPMSVRPKKARQNLKVKVMFITFFV